MAKIFLSATYEDLVEYRSVVYHTLRQMRHDAISMEDYPASDDRPLGKCLADVAACDIYLGVFAWRYGFKPKGSDKSITELEFREAVQLGKPCLIFLLAEDAPWSPKFIDSDRSFIAALREELRRSYTVQFFRHPDDLAAAVGVAVANLQAGSTPSQDPKDPAACGFYRTCLGKLGKELSSQIRFYSLSCGALAAVGCLVLAAGLVAFEGTKSVLVSLQGTLIGTVTSFPLTTLLAARRKKALLNGYEDELMKDPPALEALTAVKRFLDQQLGREQPS